MFSTVSVDRLGADRGPDPHRAVLGEVVDDRVVHQVRGHLQQQRVRAEGRGDVTGRPDGDAMLLGEGKERLGRLLRDRRQVDRLAGERPLVGAAEQEQRLGEVDRPGVHGVQTLDQLVRVALRVVAGDVEQRLGDRQRGAQLVRRVGGEAPLLGDVRLELGEHGVEGVGELPELVAPALQADPVGQRPARGQPGRLGDAGQRGKHAARQEPSAHQPEHQQERQHRGGPRRERPLQVRAVGHRTRAEAWPPSGT